LAVHDLVAVTPDVVSAVRDIVHSECQIPPDHVCVAATHTHSGPGTLRHKDGGPFVAETARRVAGAVKAAQEGRRGVTLKVAGIEVATIGRNRRHPDGPFETRGQVLV